MHTRLAFIAGAAISMSAPVPPARAGDDSSQVSGSVGLFSQYVFRGLTQSNEEPAIQGGFEYAHASGAYMGTWLSNVSWLADANPASSSDLEGDAYVGCEKTWGSEITTGAGYLRYRYPGEYRDLAIGVVESRTDELYVSLAWKWAALKYSYAVSDLFGVEDSDGGFAVERR